MFNLFDQQDLKIDTHYYLAQQLHPVVSRLCDPLEGTDSARIAQCLGLDPEHYRFFISSSSWTYKNHTNNQGILKGEVSLYY